MYAAITSPPGPIRAHRKARDVHTDTSCRSQNDHQTLTCIKSRSNTQEVCSQYVFTFA